jgi:hypothetical protein
MQKIILSLSIVLALALPALAKEAEKTEEPTQAPLSLSVLGWVEDIIIYPSGLQFSAKLDTGAKTSSIDASNIERFQDLDNKEWVRFTIQNSDGDRKTLEKRVEKWVRIKQKGGGFVQRPVIKMSLCVGNNLIEGKMNISKRDEFNYPVLIGRNMLSKNILVDSSMRRTSKPACELSDAQN